MEAGQFFSLIKKPHLKTFSKVIFNVIIKICKTHPGAVHDTLTKIDSCCPSIEGGGSTLAQHWVNVSCLLALSRTRMKSILTHFAAALKRLHP